MKGKRFSTEQIIRILHESERGEQTISDLCRKHGVREKVKAGLLTSAALEQS